MRLAILFFSTFLGLAFATATASCSHPYSGKPQKLKKPRKKKVPEEEVVEAEGPVLDEECRANFFADPNPRRKVRPARVLATEAEGYIRQAEAKEGSERVVAVKDAISKLKNSLRADPYSPQATYNMAVAYALVGKKGCAVALLQRLNDLTKMPAVESSAARIIDRANRDPRFDLFRKDADAAMGR